MADVFHIAAGRQILAYRDDAELVNADDHSDVLAYGVMDPDHGSAIVHAVNTHDAREDALREAREAMLIISAMSDPTTAGRARKIANDAIARIDAVLGEADERG